MESKVKELKLIKKDLYSVTFDNGDIIECTQDLVLKYRLVKGKVIKDIDKVYEDILVYTYYTKAINYLSLSLKSKYKMKLYLLDKGASLEISEQVIELLNEKNLLDDYKYFLNFSNHLVLKSYGKFYIEQRGILEKIDSNIINQVLSNISFNLYLENAIIVSRKQIRNYSKLNEYDKKIKLMNYLYKRGYSKDIIDIAIDEVSNERGTI